MKATDKVTVTISADTLQLLWHYINGSDSAQKAFREVYGSHMPIKRYNNKTIAQFNEVDNECDRIFGHNRVDRYEFDDETQSIPLNDEYTAEILDGKVKVGCAEFSFDAIKKLHKAIKKL